MGLDKFIGENNLNNKRETFEKLKEKFIKNGMPENIATYKASEIFTPEKLEKIKLSIKVNKEQGLRPNLRFFFDSEEDLKIVEKYFTISWAQEAVKNGSLLIDILKLLEGINNG